ncbi:DUF2142 domain-containing protein [Aerosticca soli]|uniref:Membrane protein, related to Actinobacillus protein n=1 Tax=Aerosticca soli TaxID=2010829 RepID=A0A2Z6E2S1_9GAMM|nr:DUF2142 domain-containing protein [Aerosticca soli]BBD78879.1 membrane protein, related to Actinobacillus protein [Aerosticca soli]
MSIAVVTIPPAPRRWHLFLLGYLLVAYIFSAIVPPFQAPDEFDHVKRAYMLGRGQLLLESVNGSPSGGQVDQGLLEYMAHFEPVKGNANRKISAQELTGASTIHWSGSQSRFETPTGTAYYFPALYLPSAIGLKAGETLGLTVSQSYRLARLFTLLACVATLFFAFRLYPPPTFVLAVLALPMNLFLLSAPVLDGMATSVAVLALSAFMRTWADRERTPARVTQVLVISIALVASCRANLLPLLLLPFATWLLLRRRSLLIWATVASVLVLGWTAWTVKYTVYPPGARDIDHLGRLLSYVFHPWQFLQVVYATVSDSALVSFYADSFVGVLGWLDTPFSNGVYHAFGILLALTLACSLSWNTLKTGWRWRGLLALCALAAVLLIFLALLVQWTIGPATKVDGVQGRYFTIPVLILAYALLGEPRPLAGVGELARSVLAALILAISTHYSVMALVARYHTAARQPEEADIILSPSAPLSKDRPIQLHFDPAQVAHPAGLDALSLRFGTYMTSHPGKAALRLWTGKGEIITLPFDLADLVDNAYRTFPLDGKPYNGGEILSQGGEGVSTYESRTGSGLVVECMSLHTRDDRDLLTAGCPSP